MGHHTVARAISTRLGQFRAGGWDAMLMEVTEATAAGRTRKRTPTAEDDARRIRGPMDIGELTRATAQVTDPAQIAEGADISTKLQEMSPTGFKYRAAGPTADLVRCQTPGEARGTPSQKDSGQSW